MGIVLRTLLAVNATALGAALVRVAEPVAALRGFADGAAVVELSTMLSLLLLCGLRGQVAAAPAWLQRATSVAAPALVAAAVIWLVSRASGRAADGAWGGALVAAALGAALQHYFELRVRAHSPALAEARLAALQARIRPHFLFNSLNAVLSLIRTQPRKAEIALEDLSDLLRVLLRDARDMSTLDDEVRLCRQYLAIESLRLGERLQLAWDMQALDQETLRSARIPALLLQPLLENAVHHGVEPSSTAVMIRVAMRRLVDRIEITIANPVHVSIHAAVHGEAQPAPHPGGHQMALSNIRERLALLYDVEGELTTSVSEGQFVVRLRFPFQRGRA
ncbi:sensor histidine kinase [Lacisediminimonas profundi]|uniref:sensor histidine kinase n=1 Tax=Lacisediminimonas profundi TaxID=2603856 RepID=UPI001F4F2CFA|nr:histidine kinase [Lacisediminimonas profundi]